MGFLLSQETYDNHKGKIIGGALTLIVAGVFGLNQLENEMKLPIKVVAKGKDTFAVELSESVATFRASEELVSALNTGECYMMTTKGAGLTLAAGSKRFKITKARKAPCPS